MDYTKNLIIGAGVSGLSTAVGLAEEDYLIIEADKAIGGYCKTIKQDGFTWDYSGHFFHFKDPEIESWMKSQIDSDRIITCDKKTFISYSGKWIDFPFQKNIHQLSKSDFIDCLYDLYIASTNKKEVLNFYDMLINRFGNSICEKFLFPYNEKLYACDLASLDKDAMGRFFPYSDFDEIIKNIKSKDNSSYNSTFSYPLGGAIEYINAIAKSVEPDRISIEESFLDLDLEKRIVKTTKREIQYQNLVSTIPFNKLLQSCKIDIDYSIFNWNKVLVFNLGFNKKGPENVNWIYFPNKERVFYRVGFYDNIFNTDKMSLYVEIGLKHSVDVDIDDLKHKVLEGLKSEKIITDHELISENSIVMDPAYVHINSESRTIYKDYSKKLAEHNVYSIGRYGSWTYCSIEDNIRQAFDLVKYNLR